LIGIFLDILQLLILEIFVTNELKDIVHVLDHLEVAAFGQVLAASFLGDLL
jgi:hypothetical protein